jgi:hypothetical protein
VYSEEFTFTGWGIETLIEAVNHVEMVFAASID